MKLMTWASTETNGEIMAENQEATPLHQDNLQQGVLKYLKRARLSRGGKYDLAPRPPLTPLDR
jgi:hypothetical protein